MRLSEALIQHFAAHDEPSFFIAAYPNEETKKKLKEFADTIDSKGATETLDPEEYHVTIRFIKKKDWDEEKELIKALKRIKELPKANKITAIVESIENLGEDDAFVLKLKSSGMQEAFDFIDGAIKEVGGPPSKYPKFIAHTTLYYGVKTNKEIEIPEFELKFDKIQLRDNEENVLWEAK
jgi:2'-5' RNA ligase